MANVKVERLSQEELKERGIFDWPIWEKEVSRFDWHYSTNEECYMLDGAVRVEPEDGEPVEFGSGDFVTFPSGMNCVWDIKSRVRKHYQLG